MKNARVQSSRQRVPVKILSIVIVFLVLGGSYPLLAVQDEKVKNTVIPEKFHDLAWAEEGERLLIEIKPIVSKFDVQSDQAKSENVSADVVIRTIKDLKLNEGKIVRADAAANVADKLLGYFGNFMNNKAVRTLRTEGGTIRKGWTDIVLMLQQVSSNQYDEAGATGILKLIGIAKDEYLKEFDKKVAAATEAVQYKTKILS